MLIFLDMDEVLAQYGKIQPDRVARLNRIVASTPTPARIVFNTAWNIHTMDQMRGFLVAAGFAYPDTLHSQTAGNEGGGELIRRWLRDNGEVGTPFLILDDSTRDLRAMWCRLGRCLGADGLSDVVLAQALDIIQRPIHPLRECLAAAHALTKDSERILAADWLTPEERNQYALSSIRLAQTLMEDPDFLKSAYLKA